MNNQFDKAKTVLLSHREQLSELGDRHMAIFGSTARNEATETNDRDILVDFDTKKDLFGFIDLKFYLEDILSSHVDLVSKQALHPALKKKILNESKQVF